MSDKPRVPGPPPPAPRIPAAPTGRAPVGIPPLPSLGTASPVVRPLPTVPSVPISRQEGPLAGQTSVTQNPPRTSTGRPADVHGTSNPAMALVLAGSTDAERVISVPQPGRPLDVQSQPPNHAARAERSARSTRQPRKPKAELDEQRGRFRHTLRLTPQSEQKLQEIAQSMGVDLNAAMSVCIAAYHQSLGKRGKADG